MDNEVAMVITRQQIEIATVWAVIAVLALLIWAYAAVGFWVVNEKWLKAAWNVCCA